MNGSQTTDTHRTTELNNVPAQGTLHTPGPWECHVTHDVTGYPVFYLHGFSGDEKRNIPVLQANARLIAAAPDMYALCKDLLDWVHGKRQGPLMTRDMTQRVVAAIAKAEGR